MTPLARRDVIQWLGMASALLAVGAPTSDAAAAKPKPKTRVTWTSVDFPDAAERSERERLLRSLLEKESKTENWGARSGDRLEASARVLDFQVIHKPDVVRVTCTALGKLAGGPSVRTHFSMGDHPNNQRKLERMVLTLVARGIVNRLSAVARQ